MDVVQAVVGAAKRSLANITEELLDSARERTLDKKVPTVHCLQYFILTWLDCKNLQCRVYFVIVLIYFCYPRW